MSRATDRFEALQKSSVTKGRVRVVRHRVLLRNSFAVKKYRAGESEPYEVLERHNAVTNAGKDLFLQLGVGASTDHLDNGSDLRIENIADILQKTITSCDAGFPKGSDDAGVSLKQIKYQWSDISIDTYSAYEMNIRTPLGVTFSIVDAIFGTKPVSENWIYEYTLSITSSDPDFDDTGLDHWLHALAGIDTNHFASGNTKALLVASGGTPTWEKTPSVGPTVDTGADKVTWEFIFGDGDGEIDWGAATMQILGKPFTDGDKTLRDGSTGTIGTKETGDVWTYIYEFSI